jgi:nitrogen regulatory protein PII
MKMITAYVQEFMCEKVTDALREAHVHGITVVPCMGFGEQSEGASHRYLDKTVCAGFSPKMKLEIVCADDDESAICGTIRDAANTGKHGDGKIFVSDMSKAMAIRTGEVGDGVL